jgi:hypothetical protein
MMMVAKVTGGKFVPLGKADILSKVIVGTALEGIGMEEQWATLQAEVEADVVRTAPGCLEETKGCY